MSVKEVPFTSVLSNIVDNRGRTAPTSTTGIPLIATNCIKDDRLYPMFEKVRHVSEATYATWFRDHPLPGDILFVCKGSPGRVALVPDPVGFCIAQDMVAVRADASKVYPRYLFAALRSPEVRRRIEGMHVGTLIPHFKKGDFKNLDIPLPDTETQKYVGDWYFDLSEKIESNSQAINLIQRLSSLLYTEATRAGSVSTTIGEVADFHNRRRVPLSSKDRDARPGPYPYYGATGIFGHVDDFLFDEVLVLVGEDGSVVNDNGSPVLQHIWGKSWINNHAHPLTGRRISTELLYIALSQSDIRPRITGAVQLKVNMGNLQSLSIEIPIGDGLIALEARLVPLFAGWRHLADETRRLAILRDTLLPELLSGRLHLPESTGAAA